MQSIINELNRLYNLALLYSPNDPDNCEYHDYNYNKQVYKTEIYIKKNLGMYEVTNLYSNSKIPNWVYYLFYNYSIKMFKQLKGSFICIEVLDYMIWYN